MKKQPTHVWIVVHDVFGWLPKYASAGYYASQGAAVRACGPNSRVLKFSLDNPAIVFTGKEEPADK